MSAISIEVLSTTPDVSPYCDSWERLFNTAACEPSTSFEWTDALTRSHLEATDRFLLLRGSTGFDVPGLLALVARRVSRLGCPADVAEAYHLGEVYLALARTTRTTGTSGSEPQGHVR